ncbi:MAG TPA: hypothetical protein DEG06_05725 [Lachnospiraceae bacterium]|nr:hypothetical protein [Lachnospiraceae bacterium]HBY71725.1 hypothetical protein [Lachnospiraceae bacterium]HCM12148.1 hypothetical protein [Lachnospiraceae bacterium]HCR39709.1 hypothetical protein [Lachnospiraceae bacterium]
MLYSSFDCYQMSCILYNKSHGCSTLFVHSVILFCCKSSISHRIEDPDCELSFNGKDFTIWIDGSFTGGIDFRVEATARTKGGKVSIKDGRKLIIQDAEEIIIF